MSVPLFLVLGSLLEHFLEFQCDFFIVFLIASCNFPSSCSRYYSIHTHLFSLLVLGFPGVSVVKDSPVNAGDAVLSPGDPLEKETATHSSILAWEIPWTEEPGDYNPWGPTESDMTEAT